MRTRPEREQVGSFNGEMTLNTPGLLRWLYELDASEIGKPQMREIIERFQVRARTVLSTVPPTSECTIGQVLANAWGPCPALREEAGKHGNGEAFTVDWGDVCAWLDRPYMS